MRSPRMLRLAAVAATSLLLVAGLVRAASDDYRERQAAAFKAAMAKRKQLGLDGSAAYNKLRQQYPTPEVTLGRTADGDAAALAVCPGDTAKLVIAGKFQPGTSFILQSNEVKVLKEDVTPKGWEASVSVPKNMPPDDVWVHIAAPVSFTAVTVQALAVRCTLRFKLKLDSGPTLETTLAWDEQNSDFRGPGTWKPGGAVKLTGKGSGGHFKLEQELGQDQAEASMKKLQAALESPAMKALEKRLEKAMAMMNKCTTRPPAQMEACMAGPSKEIEAVSVEREKLMAAASAPGAGCQSMDLTVKQGQVVGDATGCFDGKEHTVTGTFSSP